MKRPHLLLNLIILLIMVTVGCTLTISCAEKTDTRTQTIEDITVQEAYVLIQENNNNQNFIIIDVRSPAEYTEEHIEHAFNIDYNSGNFEDDISKFDRAKIYLIYCRTGNRSRGALNIMEKLEFNEVYHLYEGITIWIKEGYPTVR
jgi:rhodanese-related sulfurtransferase